MEQRRTKLVEEENTIYEIDMECVRKRGTTQTTEDSMWQKKTCLWAQE